jgi:hypothetical protein
MTPPEGIFYNRMSASSLSRPSLPRVHGGYVGLAQRHGRVVVNGERALQLELSKVAQYEALKAFGITTPDTIAVTGRDNIADAAENIGFPVIIKHNRAGKGLGVRLLFSAAALAEHVGSSDFEESRDGITLCSSDQGASAVHHAGRIRGRQSRLCRECRYLSRVRVVPGRCLPDRSCLERMSHCRAGDKFQILPKFEHPLLPAWQAFLAANDIDIAGVEFIAVVTPSRTISTPTRTTT